MKKLIHSETVVDGDDEPLIIPAALVAPFMRLLHEAEENASAAPVSEPDPQDRRRAFARQRAFDERSSRMARADFFSPVMFAEPGWEILLLLFLHPDDAEALTTSEVSELARVNLNTAIRWIDYLEMSNLIVRRRHRRDRRATVLTLTTTAKNRLTDYFCLPRLCAETAESEA